MAGLESIGKILSNPTWDVVAILFFVAVGFFYGIGVGRQRLIAVLFSLYASQALFPYLDLDFLTEGRGVMDIFLFKATAFSALVVLLSILFIKTVFPRKEPSSHAWWQVFLLSFLEVGLFVSALFRLFPNVSLFEFSPLVQLIFASPDAFFWWLFLPLPALFIIMRRS